MEAIPTLIGRYEVVERVARGGMGALYRARDPVLDRDVAIKVMLADFLRDTVGRTRFYREARAIARLQHRNIVTLFDFGEDEGNPYIVMEYLHGQTLAARIKHGPPLALDQALGVGAQLCTGLHFAHSQGVVHRDVKPANIWLEHDGGVKLLDFGIAKFGDTDVTRAGDVLGSISYMSPEQLSGETIDGRSDIFSAGIVMFELLSGHRPFRGESPTAIMLQIIHAEAPPLDSVPGAPPRLRPLIARALEKESDRRFQRASDFAAELRDLQAVVERQLKGPPSPTRGGLRTSDLSGTIPQRPGDGAGGGPAAAPGPAGAPGAAAGAVGDPGASDPGVGHLDVGNAGASDADASRAARGADERASRASGSAADRRGARPPTPAAAAAAADALMMRSLDGSFDPDDPAGDLRIGDPTASGFQPAPPAAPKGGMRRGWVPAGAVVLSMMIGVTTLLLVRGRSPALTNAAPPSLARADQVKAGAPPPASPTTTASANPTGGASGADGSGGARGSGGVDGSSGAGGSTGGSGLGGASGAGPNATVPAGAGASPGPPPPASAAATPGSSGAGSPGSGAPATPVAASPTAASPAPASPAAAGSSLSAAASSAGFRVLVTGSYPFDVIAEGGGALSRGRSRHELTLAGPQSLRLRSAQYCLDRVVKVAAAGTAGTPVRVNAPALGRLTVRTPHETCQIVLGGFGLGYPPIAERPVASGTYRLLLKCPDGDNESSTITIAPGATYVALIR